MENLSEFVRDQINEFKYKNDLTNDSLSKELGLYKQSLDNQLSQGGVVHYNTIEQLLNHYPELSTEWLFRGEGDMLKIAQDAVSEETELDCLRNMSKHLESISKSLSVIANKRNRN